MNKNDETKHLIANITHQAINPLNGVLTIIDNSIDGTIYDERRNQRLCSARAQLEYTITLIRNLAYFAQYGGDEPQIPKASVKTTEIPQCLIEGAMFFQEQADNKQIKIYVKNKNIQNAKKSDPDLHTQVYMKIEDNYNKYGHVG